MKTRILDTNEPSICYRCGGVVSKEDPQVIYSDGETYEVWHKQCDIDDNFERERACRRWEEAGGLGRSPMGKLADDLMKE